MTPTPTHPTGADFSTAADPALQPVTLYAPTIPAGMIILWAQKGPIPAGWLVCDGTHGTPDLRDRLPCGIPATGRVQVKDTLLAQHITLAAEHLPSHAHKANLPIPDAHYSTWGRGDGGKTESGKTLHPTELDASLMHPCTYTTKVKAGSGTSVYDRRGQDEMRPLQQVLGQLEIKMETTGAAQSFPVPLPVRTYVHFLMKA